MDQRNLRGTGIIFRGEHCKLRTLTMRDENGFLIQFYGMTAIPILGNLRYEKVGCGSNDLVKVIDSEIEEIGTTRTIPVSCIYPNCRVLESYLVGPPDDENSEWPNDLLPPQEFFEKNFPSSRPT